MLNASEAKQPAFSKKPKKASADFSEDAPFSAVNFGKIRARGAEGSNSFWLIAYRTDTLRTPTPSAFSTLRV